MTTNIFEAKQIHRAIEVPKVLCDISKQTKQKYSEYFKENKNISLQT